MLNNYCFITTTEQALSETDHLERVRNLEESGNILFGGNSVVNDSAFFLFNSNDERIPYDFIKAVKLPPLFLNLYFVNNPSPSNSTSTFINYKINEKFVPEHAVNNLIVLNVFKKDPYYTMGLVESFSISEIEMPKRSDSKELLTASKFN